MKKIMEEFDKEGFLIIRDFFRGPIIDDCYNEILENNDKVVADLIDISKSKKYDRKKFAIENNNLKYLANANEFFSSINKLITSKVHKFAEEIIQEEVYLDAVELHQKLTGASLTPPHQDNFYFCLKNGKSTTTYIPLNEQSEANGGLAVMPKSHLEDFPHYKSDVVGFSSGIKDKYLTKYNTYNYILRPCDISFHHCNIVHLAPPNNSEIPRISIALRFKSLKDKICPKKQDRYLAFANQSTRIKN